MDEIKNIKLRIKTLLKAIYFIFIFSSFTSAQNYLSIKIISDGIVFIEVNNNDPIVGLQFTLTTPNSFSIDEFSKMGRFADKDWLVSWYKNNETTLTAIAINSNLNPLQSGNGIIAKIQLNKYQNDLGVSQFVFSNVIFSDKEGNALPVIIESTNTTFSNNNKVSIGEYELANYPNPFNPRTTIEYKIERNAHVKLNIYDIGGRMIKTLCDEMQNAGYHSFVWDSTNEFGCEVSSGIYVYHLNVDGTTYSKLLVLEK